MSDEAEAKLDENGNVILAERDYRDHKIVVTHSKQPPDPLVGQHRTFIARCVPTPGAEHCLAWCGDVRSSSPARAIVQAKIHIRDYCYGEGPKPPLARAAPYTFDELDGDDDPDDPDDPDDGPDEVDAAPEG